MQHVLVVHLPAIRAAPTIKQANKYANNAGLPTCSMRLQKNAMCVIKYSAISVASQIYPNA